MINRVVDEYFELNYFLLNLGRKTIEAFLMSSQFIAFARLVQEIFWICLNNSVRGGLFR